MQRYWYCLVRKTSHPFGVHAFLCGRGDEQSKLIQSTDYWGTPPFCIVWHYSNVHGWSRACLHYTVLSQHVSCILSEIHHGHLWSPLLASGLTEKYTAGVTPIQFHRQRKVCTHISTCTSTHTCMHIDMYMMHISISFSLLHPTPHSCTSNSY